MSQLLKNLGSICCLYDCLPAHQNQGHSSIGYRHIELSKIMQSDQLKIFPHSLALFLAHRQFEDITTIYNHANTKKDLNLRKCASNVPTDGREGPNSQVTTFIRVTEKQRDIARVFNDMVAKENMPLEVKELFILPWLETGYISHIHRTILFQSL